MANWYAYNGIGDPFTAANYSKATIKPSCLNGEEPCAIYLESSLQVPGSLPQSMIDYLSNALATQTRQPQGVGSKVFVYLRAPIS